MQKKKQKKKKKQTNKKKTLTMFGMYSKKIYVIMKGAKA